MATIILMWNPNAWAWRDLQAKSEALRQGEPCEERWSVGRSKNIPIGSRAFLQRVGGESPGFVASGWVSEAPQPAPHWDAARAAAGERTNFVHVTLEVLLDPRSTPPLDWRSVSGVSLKHALQRLQGSGKSISEAASIELEDLWAKHTPRDEAIGSATVGSAREGALSWRLVKHRSRERSLRKAKLCAAMQHGPLRCEVPGCGFDFARTYGDVGEGFAHVHHLRPLASLDGEQSVSLDDLAVICPNCHAMVHRGGVCRDISTLVVSSVRAEF